MYLNLDTSHNEKRGVFPSFNFNARAVGHSSNLVLEKLPSSGTNYFFEIKIPSYFT